MMSYLAASVSTVLVAADPTPTPKPKPDGGGAMNPFDGVSPSFGPFADILDSKVGMFLGLVWAACFVYTAYHLVVSVARMAKAKQGGYGNDLDDVRTDLVKAAAATIGLVAVPVIYGVLISN